MDFLKLLGFYIVIPMVTDTAIRKILMRKIWKATFFFISNLINFYIFSYFKIVFEKNLKNLFRDHSKLKLVSNLVLIWFSN